MKAVVILLIILIVIVIGGIVIILLTNNDSEEPPLIGGCAGVSLDNRQECCDNWAQENDIVKTACVGEWTIKNNLCAWECETDNLLEGCGGSYENIQECCEKVREAQNLFKEDCDGYWEAVETECLWRCEADEVEEFCGGDDTQISCEDDNDCIVEGCCGEVCHDTSTAMGACLSCEWKDCYNASKYGLSCGCVEGKCIWS